MNFNKVIHHAWEVGLDGAVSKTPVKNIQHNQVPGGDWADAMGNNGLFKSGREWAGLSDSPTMVKNKKTAEEVANRTHSVISGQYSTGRVMIDARRDDLRSQIGGMKSQLETAQKANDLDQAKVLTNAIGKMNAEQSGLAFKKMMSYGAQAGAHTKRVGAWAAFEGNARERAIKTGAVAGAYAGLNVAGRGLSGGGVTYNNDGQRDIAGIPFF